MAGKKNKIVKNDDSVVNTKYSDKHPRRQTNENNKFADKEDKPEKGSRWV